MTTKRKYIIGGTYNIYRFYQSGKRPELIRSGLTLEEAQKWCSDPSTSKSGKWFDGYVKN